MNKVKLPQFNPYVRLAMYHTWLPYYYIDRSIYDFEFIFIDKGYLKLEIENDPLILEEGDMVLIPPDAHHKISWYKENCCQPHVHFDFNEDKISKIVPVSMKTKSNMSETELSYFRPNFLKESGLNLPYMVHSSNPSFVRNLILMIINEYTFSDPLRELKMEGILKTIIGLYISDSLGYVDENESFDTASLITRYMSENVANNLNLRDFELKSNLSSWQLNNLFNKSFNMTPKKYYDELRIKYAKNLLRNSFKTVKEISILMNFEDPQTFSRWFYNIDGRYPTQYKNEKLLKAQK